MPYVERDSNSVIVGCFGLPQDDMHFDFVDENAEEVIAFRQRKLNKLEALEAIISQGQNAMAEAPLPLLIQKQIFDLEVFAQKYYQRGAVQLIVDAINAFAIPDGYPNVTDGQRVQVGQLKGAMLQLFQ